MQKCAPAEQDQQEVQEAADPIREQADERGLILGENLYGRGQVQRKADRPVDHAGHGGPMPSCPQYGSKSRWEPHQHDHPSNLSGRYCG